ncbi:hypothetical protein Pcinc_015049 [Petrolisthes cinctipes]|uniref:Uncharacterized protein n=1 Tax=Petrolisthes cinctipes TaxID=88211 RepID=A0AAE1KR60_PETCI|nr:hypothetical protein Pcinc_015049 [Petrolisthes cinctipes]
MLNAYNLWLVKKNIDPSKKPKLREFVYNVAYQILEDFGEPITNIRDRRPNPMPDTDTALLSLNLKPEEVGGQSHSVSRRRIQETADRRYEVDGRTRSDCNCREGSKRSLGLQGYLLLESGRDALWSVFNNEEPGSVHLEESGYDVDSVLDYMTITPLSQGGGGGGGEDDWRWLIQRTGTELKVENKLLI